MNSSGKDSHTKDGRSCKRCRKKCPFARKFNGVTIGQKVVKACTERSQLQCEPINECQKGAGNDCHSEASCTDLAPGKGPVGKAMFKCTCNDGYFGTGHGKPSARDFARRGESPKGSCPKKQIPNGCVKCTQCPPGYTEVTPCTTSKDRTCRRNVLSGEYLIESDADGDRQCLAIKDGDWFPTRVNYGNDNGAEPLCGYPIPAGEASKKTYVYKRYKEAVWTIKALYTNKEGERNQKMALLKDIGTKFGTDLYTISHKDMAAGSSGQQCLWFGDSGKDIYPSLAKWKGGKGPCAFKGNKNKFVLNSQAVWKIQTVKENESKYILQSRSRNRRWECLAFEQQGAATNPARYMWGNKDNDGWCGIGNWDGDGKKVALLNNKQAVFVLSAFRTESGEAGALTCN
jgi:hypothetical protein